MVTPRAASRLPDGGRFVALDSWRGIAALAVLAYHLAVNGIGVRRGFFAQGWLAVDFFFVLSGFVISAAYEERLSKGFSIRRFMLLRLGRILPLHLFVLSIYLAMESARIGLQMAGYPVHGPFQSELDLRSLALTGALVQIFTYPKDLNWSPASWSIAVEIWLYLLASVAWRALGKAASLGAALVCILTLALLASDYNRWTAIFNPMTARGLAGFGLGMVCWAVWQRGVHARWAHVPTHFAVTLEFAAISLVAAVFAVPLPVAVADPIFAFLILIFAADRGAISRLLGTLPFVWIGTLSFSIYLMHLLIVLLIKVTWHDIFPAASPAAVALGGVAAFPVTIAVAWVGWRFIESPARNWSRRQASAMGARSEEGAAATI